jgi:SAM-dependent methyltransferase
VNVLEYAEDPATVLHSLKTALKPGGTVVVLVPNGPALFGSLDRSLGHKRRFHAGQMKKLLEGQGFAVERVYHFNRAGAPPWWAYGRILGSRNINKPVLKLFDKTVWLWRRLDAVMPWPGLSLIVVARKPAAPAPAENLPELSVRHAG